MKISVVIPVYNGEKYIEKCLKSILGQTYKNIEVIIINDGSEDNSEIICKQMQEKDNRIIIFSQKNSGTSIARKKGILNASGDYIMFSDQDDYYNNHKAFEEIVKKILEYPEGKVSVLQYSNYKKFRFFKVKNTCKKCEITKEEFQEKQDLIIDGIAPIFTRMRSGTHNKVVHAASIQQLLMEGFVDFKEKIIIAAIKNNP